MKTGDWVMYEATHGGTKETRLGKARFVAPEWVDVTWYWIKDTLVGLNSSTTVMRKYCTPLTEEVAQVFLTANKLNEKE